MHQPAAGTTATKITGGGERPARRRSILATCCGTHFTHDGFSDVIYLLLPLWQIDFALSLTQVGVVKSCFSATLAIGQIPAGLLAERVGERSLLAIGTVITGVAFVSLGMAGGFASLIVFLLLAGLGSSVQHPLCSSVVSKAFDGKGLRTALGIYNFSGDVGKAVVPVLAALVVGAFGWRWVTGGYGMFGFFVAGALFASLLLLVAGGPVLRTAAQHAAATPLKGWGIRHKWGFRWLSGISIIDGASRTAFLTFLPFLLIAKGAAVETIGFSLALVFIGGATGKFLCGVLAERFGIIRTVILTEIMTAGGILLLLALPLLPSLFLLPLVGLALNGTSSVLYGTVAEFVHAERRSRGFGLFYTLGIGGSALSPTLFGVLSDAAGVETTLAALSGFILLTLPLAVLLQGPLRQVNGMAAERR